MVLLAGVIGGFAACCTAEVLASESSVVRQYGIFLPFTVSCIVLVLGQGKTQVPTTHHITLCASYAVAAGGSVLWGVLAGIAAQVTGDFLGRVFHVHGDVYICPAAMSIVVISLLTMGLLPAVNAYALPDALPLAVLAVSASLTAWLQHRDAKAAPADLPA